jgi:hypothetical protein
MKKETYIYFSDPSHAWLRVKISEIEKMGIGLTISKSSYRKGQYAYLEEDSDAPKFLKAKFGESLNLAQLEKDGIIKTSYADKTTVRDFDNFVVYNDDEKLFMKIIKNKMYNLFSGKNSRKRIMNAELDSCKYWNEYYNFGVM